PAALAWLPVKRSPQNVSEMCAPSYESAPPSPPLPGLPPVPVAELLAKVLLTMVTFSSCVPTAPPLEPLLSEKVLPTMRSVPTPCPLMAPPETSCPLVAHWLCANVQSMTVSEPPSSKMAPPPCLVLVVLATSLVKPPLKVRCCTVRSGVATSKALVRCRIRVAPPPERVTVPPPSIVVSLATGISAVTVMVTGSAPQRKVTMPPAATALRSAASVQLAAVPSPTTVVGVEVSTGCAGTSHTVAGGGG